MVESYSNLAWRETLPGRWEREIDEAERFYTCLAKSYEGSGRLFFAITGFVSISVPFVDATATQEVQTLVDASIRQAWLRLRYDHPTIASQVQFEQATGRWMKVYGALDGNSNKSHAQQWLEQTFIPVKTDISGLEWCNSDPPAPSTPSLFVLRPSLDDGQASKVLRRDLVIRSPHDIMDGIGTLQLLNNLLKHIAQAYEQPTTWSSTPPWDEAINLSPPLRIAASIPADLSSQQSKRVKDIVEQNAKLRTNTELLTIPFKKGAVVPGKHQRAVVELSEPATTQILQAAKALGATVTHVYHAAIVGFLRNLKSCESEPRTVRYVSYGLVNQRFKCHGEFATPKHAAAVYHSVSGESLAIDVTVPSIQEQRSEFHRQAEFKSIVERVKMYYSGIRDDPDAIALAPSFWSMGTPYLVDPASPVTSVPPPNLTPSISISSMGVIDKLIEPKHGVFEAKSPWVTGEELGTGLGVFLGSWKGKLSLSVAYNDAWHDADEMSAFLAELQHIAWRGLGLPEGRSISQEKDF